MINPEQMAIRQEYQGQLAISRELKQEVIAINMTVWGRR